MSMTRITTREVEIDKIDVDPAFNSREHFDQAELEALAETIKLVGVVQPVRVRPAEDGRFTLVAASAAGGPRSSPGSGRPPASPATATRARRRSSRTTAASTSTRSRPRLTSRRSPHNLTTNAKIAATLNPARPGEKRQWVADHLRLLRLPEEVQRYFAAGDVPVAAEPKLRRIAAVSPAVAAWICEVARHNGISEEGGCFQLGEVINCLWNRTGPPRPFRSSARTTESPIYAD